MAEILDIPSKESTSQQWIDWHKALRKAGFSRNEANGMFADAWAKRETYVANDQKLRDYMKSQGYDLDAFAIDDVGNFLADPFGIVSNFQFAAGFTKWIIIIVAIVFVLFLIYMLYNIAKNPGTVAKVGAAAATKNAAFLA